MLKILSSINKNMSKTVEKKIEYKNSIWYTLKKATTKNSEWPDKVKKTYILLNGKNIKCLFVWFIQDEFLDVIYWARQIIGLIAGLLWGFLPLKGFFGLGL